MGEAPGDRDHVTASHRFDPKTARFAFRTAAQLAWTDEAGAHEVTIKDRMLAGGAAGADLVIADPTVSRIHAEFSRRDDGLWVRDLKSKNGTFVQDVLTTEARVPENGRVRLGSTILTARLESAKAVEIWPDARLGGMVGQSVTMRALFASLVSIARTSSSVLIDGETGTGKELVARAIHDLSPRAKMPFIVVDCAALPENLLESELFGHVRGAFTGATHTHQGAIEAAEGGTVFLDEIGELPLAMQPKLLRVLESRTVRPLGAPAYRQVDVRFVSATHRDLRVMVNAGSFREDLYFRLAVVPVHVPPLRERPEDVMLLIEHFLPEDRCDIIDAPLREQLMARQWIGNVRELRNFVERAVALGTSQAMAMAHHPGVRGPGASASASTTHVAVAAESGVPSLRVPVDRAFKDAREEWLEHLEREYFRVLLARHGRNVTAVAQAAGIDRTYVYRLIRKHDL